MKLELQDKEGEVIRHALEVYLSNLRGEISNTKKREFRDELHKEEVILKEIISRMN